MNIIMGKRGSGKTYELIERIKNDPAEKKLVILSHSCRIEYFKQKLREHGVDPETVLVLCVPEFARKRVDLDLTHYHIYIDDFNSVLYRLLGSEDITATVPTGYFSIEEANYTPPKPKNVIRLSGTLEELKALIPYLKMGKIILRFQCNSYLLNFSLKHENEAFLKQYHIATCCGKEGEDYTIDYYWSHGCESIAVLEVEG